MAKRITDKQRIDYIAACGVLTLIHFKCLNADGTALIGSATVSGNADLRAAIDEHMRGESPVHRLNAGGAHA